jgi:hypothetical protein
MMYLKDGGDGRWDRVGGGRGGALPNVGVIINKRGVDTFGEIMALLLLFS